MKVGVFGQFYHDDSEEYILTLLEALDEKGIRVMVEAKYLELIRHFLDEGKDYETFSSFEDLDPDCDMFFSMGGDGTMLRTILYIRDLGIPVLGINTGRLGFLATVQKEDIRKAVDSISRGSFDVVDRALLEVHTDPVNQELSEFNFALNEVAVSRKDTTSMITVATYLNDEYLTSYWADGLIIATPTGSTGYSLSCGGPVLTPDTTGFVITPIAPHNLNARPLVIPDDTVIKLKVSGREKNYLISLDSRLATLPEETEITIKKSTFAMKMVELRTESFLKTLRNKLLWGEDKRN
ncbi:NAD kinase [Sinomicrobium weinanense]|uniref:NAD kinase n=1 Tax=Sinomicrobium weinanense TaxID=2842200 RepID=A0A926JT19_9FLAO|nr:NAD kinase [Sinomicrobium weinanense]MBC9796671.1 NAD kinase [Sinomicrobium weinanense]MBU3124921.1 NAD kinase [Sinomicrobium weinanense]